MKTVEGLKYSKEHEWVKVEGNRACVGITDFAQHSLGDIVFVDLPELDTEIAEGDALGVVESVKAASDVYSPLSGTIVEINDELIDAPEKINELPYESWIAVIELSNLSELDNLLDVDSYRDFCEKGE